MAKLLTPPTSPSAGSPNPGGSAVMPPVPRAKSFDIVDLKQYFHVIVKRIWLVALCFAVSLAVTVVMLVRQVPVYRSTTTLLVSKGLPIPQRVKQDEREVLGDYMETQIRILHSGFLVSMAKERLNRPADDIQKNLVRVWADIAWRTSIIYIRCDSLDPLFAADFANAVAEAYLSFKSEERLETSQSTVISLTQQANRLLEELKKADERILTFEKENSVVAIQERGNIAAGALATLASRAAAYRTERMLMEAQQPLLAEAPDETALSALMSPISPFISAGQPLPVEAAAGRTSGDGDASRTEQMVESGLLVSPGGFADLKKTKVRLERRLAMLREKYREAHPDIQRTITELRDIEQDLKMELDFALHEFYTSLDALAIREKAARKAELMWEDEALESSRKLHEYQNIQRDVARLSGLYDLLFNRLKEVDVAIGIEPESIRVLERAVPSYSPITPRKLQTIFLAAVVGLVIGLGLVFGLEYIDDSLRYPEEVQRDLGLTFLGVIPAANWDPEDLRTHLLTNIDQKSGLAEAYRNVRSALLFTADQEKNRVLAVTSAVPKEGKTTTCLNMAVSMAQAGMRVLLVDGDLRRGELHKFYGLEGGRGLADVLTGQAKPESVIQRTGLPNLDLVATGPFPPNPAELILHGEFSAFLDFARRSYDRVFIDCPPVMAVSEAAILASMVDGVVVIVWAGQTSRKLSQLAVQVLRQRGANLLGCVLNNLEFGRVGYYYYSTYYGYYNYNYRYDQS